MIFFADLESSIIDDQHVGVYLGYIEPLDQNVGFHFLTIKDMFDYIIKINKNKDTNIVYFHNLSWDAEFIIWWLIDNGFTPEHTKISKSYQFKERTDYLGSRSELYLIYKGKKIMFLDSYKLWPYKLEEIGKSLNFEKLEINHEDYIHYDHLSEVPKDKLEYVKRDVQIMKLKYSNYARTYKIKKTASSSSWENFKNWYNQKYDSKTFKYKYMINEEFHEALSCAYFGGLTQFNPKYVNQLLEGEFNIYDVNSSYPSIFVDELLPYGMPLASKPDGDYVEIVEAIISNISKKDVQMIDHLHNWAKNGKSKDLYISNYDGSLKIIYTRQEYEEIKKTYSFETISETSIYFKADKTLADYISKMYTLKENESDKVLRNDHKQILNTFTGKWGQSLYRTSKQLRLATDHDERKYHYNNYVYDIFPDKSKEIKYIPIAIFVTSLARVKLLRTIRSNINSFVYCDTDSVIFIENKRGYDNIKIDDKKLGFWKKESMANKIKILKPKFYILQLEDGSLKRTLAGINKECHNLYNFDNFYFGSKIKDGNIKKVKLKGGYMLKKEDVVI